MRSKAIRCITVLTFIATLAISPRTSGQQQKSTPHHHYKLIDLGTLGGPASYFSNGFDGILNDHGTAVGWADTSAPDPFPMFCFNPTSTNCFVAHAFQWQDGVRTDLGALPGGASSQAIWITANGLIAGNSQNGEQDPLFPGWGEFRAVIWKDGNLIDLGTLEGGHESFMGSVNSKGQVAGLFMNAVPDPFNLNGPGFFPTQSRAFLWQNDVMQDLGTLGGTDAQAVFINEGGQIVGNSYTNTTPNPTTGVPTVDPFLWENGAMIDLGTLGGTNSSPLGFNNRGEVVGVSNVAGDTFSHPFLWTKHDGMRDLGTLGGNTGFVNWINDQGNIVGKADLPGPLSPQDHHAVLWRHGVQIDLGTFPEDSSSNAYYVNSPGQVVGTSEDRAHMLMGVGEHAFLWEDGGPMVDLNTLIPAGSSLALTYAVAINNDGMIAGFGVPPGVPPEDYEIQGHAYILIPCDENHPNIQGCDYSLVDASTATDVRPAQAIQATALTSTATAVLTITSGAPPAGIGGVSYGGFHRIILDRPYPALFSFTGWELTAASGAGSYHWSWSAVPGSTLPPGLTVKVDEAVSGGSTRCCETAFIPVIGGTPTVPGTYRVIVTVTDSSSPPNHASATYTITILR